MIRFTVLRIICAAHATTTELAALQAEYAVGNRHF